MSTVLRELLAKFSVSVDPEGNLDRGHAQVDGLKAALAQLETRLAGLKNSAAPAAKAVSDAFARAGADVNRHLAMTQARSAFSGRDNSDAWGAAGAMRSGPMQGPTRDTLNAFQSSWRGRLQALSLTARGVGASAAQAFGQFKTAGAEAQTRVLSLRNAFLGLGVVGGARFAAGLIDQIGGIGEAAQKLGLSGGDFQRLKVLAEQNATSVESLGGAFRVLGKNAVDPTKDTTEAFAKLGVQTRDGNGAIKSRQDLFFETAGALADVSNEAERGSLAQKLFGRSAQELLPMLSQGRAGLDAQREALLKLKVVQDADIKAADELGDRFIAFRTELIARAAPALTKYMIPAFEKLIGWVGKAVDWLEKLDAKRVALVGLTAAALAFGKTFALAGASAALSWAPFIAAFIAVEDFIGFLQGDISATGALADKLFGPGGGERLRQQILDIVAAVKELLGMMSGDTTAAPALAKVLGVKVNGPDTAAQQADLAAQREDSPITAWISDLLKPANFDAEIMSARAAAGTGPAVTDSRTQQVTVNVGSVAEVQGAVAGAQQGLGARSPQADFAAVGGDYL